MNDDLTELYDRLQEWATWVAELAQEVANRIAPVLAQIPLPAEPPDPPEPRAEAEE